MENVISGICCLFAEEKKNNRERLRRQADTQMNFSLYQMKRAQQTTWLCILTSVTANSAPTPQRCLLSPANI